MTKQSLPSCASVMPAPTSVVLIRSNSQRPLTASLQGRSAPCSADDLQAWCITADCFDAVDGDPLALAALASADRQ